ncbi:AraC family transcriptional regulator [Paenibacillus puerhi]|uniref:AraC family transcriptional regulator n=1 Tax=Paenibacillus puerhi TaxID=2692622 RepID=UPI0013572C62|nr:AraC family transcriptional regulator [Paenibacillus puerhi]
MAYREYRKYPDEFPFSCYLKSGGFHYLPHWHTEIEMLYVLQGTFTMTIGQKMYQLQPGDIAICDSGDIHHYHGSGSSSAKAILLLFHPKLIGIKAGERSPFSVYNHIVKLEHFDDEKRAELVAGFRRALEEFTLQSEAWEMYTVSEINRICGTLTRHQPNVQPHFQDKFAEVESSEIIQQVLRYLEQNYNHENSLMTLSKTFNVSPYHLSRLFNKCVGMNFRSYLNRLRILQAEQLIKTTNESLCSIAFHCGFESVRSFNRSFKAVLGEAPSSLRKHKEIP